MADTAAHLVDSVLPRDPAWTSWVGNLVVRAIGVWQRRVARARRQAAPKTAR